MGERGDKVPACVIVVTVDAPPSSAPRPAEDPLPPRSATALVKAVLVLQCSWDQVVEGSVIRPRCATGALLNVNFSGRVVFG
jgi:hypothetical protein